MTRTRIARVLLLLAVAVGVAFEALTFKVSFPTDPLGPAAFPLIGAGLLALGAISLWRLDRDGGVLPDSQALRRITLATVSFLAYAALLAPLGFVLATTAEFATLALLFGGRPARSLAAGLAFALLMFALFVYGLGLPLPVGALFS